MNILQQAIEDKLTAAFYTDKWPNILTVVCETFSPRISDVSHNKLGLYFSYILYYYRLLISHSMGHLMKQFFKC